MENWVGLRFLRTSRTIWAKSRVIDNQEYAKRKDSPRNQFLGKNVKIMADWHDTKGWYKTLMGSNDILEHAWITLQLLEPLETLTKRAARSGASNDMKSKFR